MRENTTVQEPNQTALHDIPSVGKKDGKKNNVLWVGMIVMVLVVYGFLKSCSHTSKAAAAVNNNSITQAENNIDALKQKLSQANQAIVERGRLQSQAIAAQVGDTSQNPQAYSKTYLARLTADDTVFEASNNAAATGANTNNGSVNTLNGATASGKTLTGDDPDSQFLNNSANAPPASARAQQMTHLGFTVMQGTLIPAVLEPAINSDLPGMVRAHTIQPIYSYNGARVLIPMGSRLIGQYTSAVIQGQNRIYIAWNRLVTPSGVSIMLNSPDTDTLGRSGEGADVVLTHFWSRFGEASLLSILGGGVSTVGVNSGTQYNSAAQFRTGIAQGLSQSAQQSLQGSLPQKPTLIKYQGALINVFVARDLSFYNALNPSLGINQVSTLPLTSSQIQRLKALIVPNE